MAAKAKDVEIKAQVYKDPRPAETFAPFHERVRDHPPEWIYEVVRTLTVLNALVTFRAEGYGSENVPERAGDPRPEPRLVHGPLLRRRVHPPPRPVHGEVPDVRSGPAQLGLQPRRRLPGPPRLRTTRRRSRPRSRILDRGGVDRHVRRGRPLAAPARSVTRQRRGSVGWRSSPGVPVVPVAILGSHQVRNWTQAPLPQGRRPSTARPFRFERVADADARAAAGSGGADPRADPGDARRARLTRHQARRARAPHAPALGRRLSGELSGRSVRSAAARRPARRSS